MRMAPSNCTNFSSVYVTVVCLSPNTGVQRRRYAVRWNRLLADPFLAPSQKPSKTFILRSGEVEAVGVHHLSPRRYEVLHKLLLRVRASIDLGQSPELGVRTED